MLTWFCSAYQSPDGLVSDAPHELHDAPPVGEPAASGDHEIQDHGDAEFREEEGQERGTVREGVDRKRDRSKQSYICQVVRLVVDEVSGDVEQCRIVAGDEGFVREAAERRVVDAVGVDAFFDGRRGCISTTKELRAAEETQRVVEEEEIEGYFVCLHVMLPPRCLRGTRTLPLR